MPKQSTAKRLNMLGQEFEHLGRWKNTYILSKKTAKDAGTISLRYTATVLLSVPSFWALERLSVAPPRCARRVSSRRTYLGKQPRPSEADLQIFTEHMPEALTVMQPCTSSPWLTQHCRLFSTVFKREFATLCHGALGG